MEVLFFLNQLIQLCKCFLHKLSTAGRRYLIAELACTVAFVFRAALGRKIATANKAIRLRAKLYDKGLLWVGACLNPVAVVEEELKGVGGDGYIAEADDVTFGGVYFGELLLAVALDSSGVDVHFCLIGKVEDLFILILVYVIFDLADCVLIVGAGRLAEREVQVDDRMYEGEIVVKLGDLLVDRGDLVGNSLTYAVTARNIIL